MPRRQSPQTAQARPSRSELQNPTRSPVACLGIRDSGWLRSPVGCGIRDPGSGIREPEIRDPGSGIRMLDSDAGFGIGLEISDQR
jgi:hypothetical protein